MKFTCPTCKSSRHVAEVGSGEVIETTGEPPTVDSCWYCGTPVPYTDEEIADMERAWKLTKYDIQRVYDVPPWLADSVPLPRFARLRWMFRRVWPRGVWGPRP